MSSGVAYPIVTLLKKLLNFVVLSRQLSKKFHNVLLICDQSVNVLCIRNAFGHLVEGRVIYIRHCLKLLNHGLSGAQFARDGGGNRVGQ